MTKALQHTRTMIVFALLGTILFLSDIIFEAIPNVHGIAPLLISYTIVYRWRALISLYIYVALTGISWGFHPSFIPYLYIWLPLFLLAHLVKRTWKKPLRAALYCAIAALHGIAFGLLYVPFWSYVMGFDLQMTLAWVAAGLPFDLAHAIGNTLFATLAIPIASLLSRLEKGSPTANHKL